ncbi:hypothetical protein P3T27_005969 [Kitasatospora sp. MAA19]|uniref:hypothetical protein n=1 Tax=unclassified Kitasatospora TaxID=2633591 RepID=UPI0024736A93|nr:hypothetical protein [Kitasatospora sp. MAA19]MDH6709223.1 hypothetical protein [Kitasatospora sp. MAA19]
MSKRNDQAAKKSARERMRAERERQERAASRRRKTVIAGIAVAVVAAAVGISIALVGCRPGGGLRPSQSIPNCSSGAWCSSNGRFPSGLWNAICPGRTAGGVG